MASCLACQQGLSLEEYSGERNDELKSRLGFRQSADLDFSIAFSGEHLDAVGILVHQRFEKALEDDDIVETGDFLNQHRLIGLVDDLRLAAGGRFQFRLTRRDDRGVIFGVHNLGGNSEAKDVAAECARDRRGETFNAAQDFGEVLGINLLANVLIDGFNDIEKIFERLDKVAGEVGFAVLDEQSFFHRLLPSFRVSVKQQEDGRFEFLENYRFMHE